MKRTKSSLRRQFNVKNYMLNVQLNNVCMCMCVCERYKVNKKKREIRGEEEEEERNEE